MDNLQKQALKLLEKNTKTTEYKGRIYKYTVPSEGPYPFQWLWDSCFHAISFAALGQTERAEEELRGIFARQKQDGAIYHIIFWDKERLKDYLFDGSQGFGRFLENKGFWLPFGFMKPPQTSAYTQPPLLATAVEYIYKKSGNKEFIKEVLPKLYKYYDWLYRTRDDDSDGLVSIFTQFESGLDYSPVYDEEIGYKRGEKFPGLYARARIPQIYNKFVLGMNSKKIFERGKFHREDVLFNSILIRALYSLRELADIVDNSEISAWADKNAKKSLSSLLGSNYDDASGVFYDLSGNEERSVKINTIGSLMPLIIPGLSKNIVKNLVERHLSDSSEFFSKYPLASVALSEEAFNESGTINGKLCIWRGPLSMNTNWFLAHALRDHGYSEIADHISEKSRELVEKHGFWEFFNPINGEPVGAENFGWATLAVDM